MSSFRWVSMDLPSYLTSSWIFRWPEVDFSYLSLSSLRMSGFSIIDDVLWSFVTIVESLALVAMLCCYFLLCGCTL
ncbi:PREDICTED: uncharacterized protein LOC109116907 [Tarenaya hassleriana]|uniref:uncharacterized protein LOC109116907 n=1 Tax=Tarenaya hassleriana TaxID=28532 RepID=UPI0008FD20F4|nr:PREDICTED: uncharacterized protein LOC109116907 [Tarenaya hassleriana]